MAKCHQATASDLPFYDIFAPQKITFSKISDDVIAFDVWFGSPPIKNPGYAYGSQPLLLFAYVTIIAQQVTIKDASMVRYASIFAKKYTFVRYGFFVMVRVRYAFLVIVRFVGTLFKLKIPDSSHIAPAFCMQRQKTAEADAKCVNWDRRFID